MDQATACKQGTPTGDLRAPICVYVLHHHECLRARDYSQDIFDWLRGLYVERGASSAASRIDLQRLGLGIPVYYRTSFADPAGESGDLSIRDIQFEHATCNVIVPLIDEKMVNDPRWRDYLRRAANRNEGDTVVLPVALHDSAYRLDHGLGGRNFIRLGKDDPPHDLRRRLVEACLRALARGHDYADKPKLEVFISHAKGDARSSGARYRDAIQRYGQIDAFFDENDIPYGVGYRSILTERSASVDAMLCIHSDMYSSRPWCRLEVSEARKPRPAKDRTLPGGIEIYTTIPILVVDHLDRHATRFLPEFGHVTVIRGVPGGEENVLDMLMRESMNARHQAATAELLANSRSTSSMSGSTVFLNFVPDLTSLHKIAQLRKREEKPSIKRVIYPGAGLTRPQRDELEELGGQLQLVTFQELNDELE